MVLEDLINAVKAERKPWEMFFIGILYAVVGILLSLWIFEAYSSLVMVFICVIASSHIMYSINRYEENKDLQIHSERLLLKEHARALSFFTFLFLGFVVTYALAFTVLPQPTVDVLFRVQTATINSINNVATGDAIATSNALISIFFNNIKVWFFCILFAFFFGIGAVFILAWNASVIGAAIGIFAKSSLPGNHFMLFSMGLARYLTHGIPEIIAYFTAGLAAGIISIAIARHDFGSKKFTHILIDSTDLLVLSFFMLFIAALIEVFITPAFF